jgi:hypothetical protein
MMGDSTSPMPAPSTASTGTSQPIGAFCATATSRTARLTALVRPPNAMIWRPKRAARRLAGSDSPR